MVEINKYIYNIHVLYVCHICVCVYIYTYIYVSVHEQIYLFLRKGRHSQIGLEKIQPESLKVKGQKKACQSNTANSHYCSSFVL